MKKKNKETATKAKATQKEQDKTEPKEKFTLDTTQSIQEEEKQSEKTESPANAENENDGLSDLERDLQVFEETTTSFKVPKQELSGQSSSNPVSSISAPELSPNDFFKLQMFFGFFCYAIAGVNAFLFDFMSKYEITTEDMALNNFEKTAIRPYLQSPKILAWINKIPDEWIAIIHIEYIMFQKFNKVQRQKKEDNAPLKISKRKNKKENE